MEKELAPGADVGVITHCEVALLPCDHTQAERESQCGKADRPERQRGFIWRAVISADHSDRSLSWPHGDGGLRGWGKRLDSESFFFSLAAAIVVIGIEFWFLSCFISFYIAMERSTS